MPETTTMDMTPTLPGYLAMLDVIRSSSASIEDREWAAAEIERVSGGRVGPFRAEA
jgi:hypothetical protein